MRHDPPRLLHAAAATLAAGVVSDSTAEHYRAGFHNRAMFVAPIVSSMALASALSSTFTANGRAARTLVSVVSIVTGLVGVGFHLSNVARRPGGWSSANVFHGAPMAAPLAITMAGLLGLAARRINSKEPPASAVGRAIGAVSALGLLGTSAEAAALHFRGAFQNPFMYAPVAIPPIAAVTLGATMMARSSAARPAARALLRLTGWLGVVGVGFHAWGVHRRMGGWRNWRQNLLVGPPLPAPPALAGLALAGLAALELLDTAGGQ
jgi:hypothetical protein